MTEPKRPTSGGWFRKPDHVYVFADGQRSTGEVYDSLEGIRVVSAVDDVDDDTADGRVRPHFHISVTHNGGRALRDAKRRALRDFGMQNSQEDNHVPNGKARNFWLPVGVEVAPECGCVNTEEPHDEGDEYVWREVPKR